jgi:hypothetical protein
MSTGAAKGLHMAPLCAVLAALGHNMSAPPKASTCNNWQWRIASWGASGFGNSGRRRFAERRDLGGYLLLKLGFCFCWFVALNWKTDTDTHLLRNIFANSDVECILRAKTLQLNQLNLTGAIE